MPIRPFMVRACVAVALGGGVGTSLVSQHVLATTDHHAKRALTVLVFGDGGTGESDQRTVAGAMGSFCRTGPHRCDFGLVLGDLIYGEGVRSATDPRFATQFEIPYDTLGALELWMVAGNHDHGTRGSVEHQVAYSQASRRWRMPASHYAIPKLPAWLHIYALDTEILRQFRDPRASSKKIAAGRAMLAGARRALCGKEGWRILIGHHPVYSSGPHVTGEDALGVSRSMQSALKGVIDDCEVQLYLAGHEHHQELVQVGRFLQVVQGAGGAAIRPTRDRDPALVGSRWVAETHGFASIEFTASQLTLTYFAADSDGARRLCSWTRLLSGAASPGDASCALR